MRSNIATRPGRKSVLLPNRMGMSGRFQYKTTASVSNRNIPSVFSRCSKGYIPADNTPAPALASPFARKLWNSTEERFGWNQSPETVRLFYLPFHGQRGRRHEFKDD